MTDFTAEDLAQGKGLRCPACDDRNIARITCHEDHVIRGVKVTVECVLRQCQACGAEFEFSRDPDWHVEAFAKVREICNFLTPDAIREWREARGLRQEDLAERLNWTALTVWRYENGSLQTEAHDAQLRDLMGFEK